MSVLEYVLFVVCWSSPDGKDYLENLEFYEDQKDQQDCVNQGKYSMGLPWCPPHFNHFILHVSNFINYNDILVVDDNYLDT